MPQDGVEQGRAVLADLARHPATAAHVARKLARHFSADEPPDALVERLAKRFLDTDGDLKEIAKALIEAPETWDEQRMKLKRPSEWLISAWRAIGVAPDAARGLHAQAYLGERLWRPNAPKGFPDEQSAWIDGLAQRLDIANRIGELVAATDRARDVRSRPRSGRSRQPRRGRPSRAPKAASRRSRWR